MAVGTRQETGHPRRIGVSRHRRVRAARYPARGPLFELAGNLPVEVVFVVGEEEAARLLELVRQEKIRVFYVLMPAEFGVVNGE